jgi:hypothetical protein
MVRVRQAVWAGAVWTLLLLHCDKTPAVPTKDAGDAGESRADAGPKLLPTAGASSSPSATESKAREVVNTDLWTDAESKEPGALMRLASGIGPDEIAEVAEEAASSTRRSSALAALEYVCTAPRSDHLGGSCPMRVLLPLSRIATDRPDDALFALRAASTLASSRERAEDPEDFEEVREACQKLVALAKSGAARPSRVQAARIVKLLEGRKLPRPWLSGNACSAADLPKDLENKP